MNAHKPKDTGDTILYRGTQGAMDPIVTGRQTTGGQRAGESPTGTLFRLLVLLGLAALTGSPLLAQPGAADPFIDVTQQAGIDTPHSALWAEVIGDFFTRGYLSTGQAWGDYDNDGWVDLYLSGGLDPGTLYRNNRDGTFSISEHSSDVALPDTWSGGAVWADYDNDGWKDLYVLAHGANVLLHNEAGRGFRDVTASAGVGDTRKGTTATWGDYDADGFLDLYVANWACLPECQPADPLRASDRLYHNRGDGSFEDVSHLLGDKLQGAAFSASFVDFDDDGDPDIYVVNDQGEHPIGNVLWRNDGPGCSGWCWSEVSRETHSNLVKNGMGLAVGDYDNDLDLDFYFSDMIEPMALLENLGADFRNATRTAGVGGYPSIVGWGTAFFDFDNDGWLDLFLATTEHAKQFDFPSASFGMLYPLPNVLFENNGDGTFGNVTPTSWQEQPRPSMGVAYADYDQDGRVDLVVGNFGQDYSLFRNTGAAGADNHWLTVRLEGRPPVNRDAIHARVFVTTGDGLTRMQEVKSGSSMGAGNDTALHFGLGEATSATVRVVWPDGSEVVFEGVASDQIWELAYEQTAPLGQTLGPEFNTYNADHIPENDPHIAQLLADMTGEQAIAILQRELVAAQFFGLDGEKAEHWGTADTAPESTATRTLTVDRQELSWRSMAQHEQETLATFRFEEAVQIWTRFSMAESTSHTDPPSATPQGVILYLLTDVGVDDVMQYPIPLSKILPSYPGQLPSYPPDAGGRFLIEPGLFIEGGRPDGFAVCCFSSTGLGETNEPHLPLERLPLVIAAFQKLSPNLVPPDTRGLLLTNPLADPSTEEAATIIARCNLAGFDNQGVFLCQNDQLNSLAYMKSHAHGMMGHLVERCSAEWVGDYLEQAKCVLNTMMEEGP